MINVLWLHPRLFIAWDFLPTHGLYDNKTLGEGYQESNHVHR